MRNVFSRIEIIDGEKEGEEEEDGEEGREGKKRKLEFDADHFSPPPRDFLENEKLREAVEKRTLVDLYMQGLAMNAFGSYYSYINDALSPEEQQVYLKEKYLGSAFHSFQLLGIPVRPPRNVPPVLGEERIVRDANGELKVEARAIDASILTQEMFKGFYEYLFLDTSVPAKGEVSDEEAELFRRATQNHLLEPIGFVFGPIVARRVNEMLHRFTEENPRFVARLVELDDIESYPVLTQALLAKVVTMLPAEDIRELFHRALRGEEIGEGLIHAIAEAKVTYDLSE